MNENQLSLGVEIGKDMPLVVLVGIETGEVYLKYYLLAPETSFLELNMLCQINVGISFKVGFFYSTL